MSLNLTKYHGGKAKLADWIISHMPPHKCYVEAFGGMASVLLSKRSAQSEVYNDINGEVVNVFRMVRERGEELAHKINMTLFARDEMELAYEWTDDPLEQARRFLVRSEMAVTTTSINEKSGLRSAINGDYASQFFTFYTRPEVILKVRERLARVCIENTDAINLLKRFDKPQTLFYLDPPYLNSTRGASSVRKGYQCNMTDAQHVELLEKCLQLKGMCMISGYPNELYDDMLKDWHRVGAKAYDDAKNKKVEVLWMNYSGAQIRMDF